MRLGINCTANYVHYNTGFVIILINHRVLSWREWIRDAALHSDFSRNNTLSFLFFNMQVSYLTLTQILSLSTVN